MSNLTSADAARFWAKADASDLTGCWLWTKGRFGGERAYGQFQLAGRPELAHRVAYELAVGPIPAGMEIDHTCHVGHCVNPAHLRIATRKQNAEHRGAFRNNRTGVRGVSVDPRNGRFRVHAQHRGRTHSGGTFVTLAEAEAAAIALRNRLFTHNDADKAEAA